MRSDIFVGRELEQQLAANFIFLPCSSETMVKWTRAYLPPPPATP